MSYSRAATFDAQKSLAFGSIGASYTIVDSILFSSTRMLMVVNATDALLQFSTTGATDHFVIPASTSVIFDFASNDAQVVPWFLPAKKAVYVKEIGTPTTGAVYVTAIYGIGD